MHIPTRANLDLFGEFGAILRRARRLQLIEKWHLFLFFFFDGSVVKNEPQGKEICPDLELVFRLKRLILRRRVVVWTQADDAFVNNDWQELLEGR